VQRVRRAAYPRRPRGRSWRSILSLRVAFWTPDALRKTRMLAMRFLTASWLTPSASAVSATVSLSRSGLGRSSPTGVPYHHPFFEFNPHTRR
jgi:hypothetical protein